MRILYTMLNFKSLFLHFSFSNMFHRVQNAHDEVFHTFLYIQQLIIGYEFSVS
ncbi:hypothetical protein C0J52_26219 [Blattella germanica]|nr:hypothetical protein C0J52_26219 [Blattella germanica]